MAKHGKKRKWKDLEVREKLGYLWVLSFIVLIVSTFIAIMAPVVEQWRMMAEDAETGLIERLIEAPTARGPEMLPEGSANGLAGNDNSAGAPRSLPLGTRLG